MSEDPEELPVWEREIDPDGGGFHLVRELFRGIGAYHKQMNEELHCATAVLLSSQGRAHIDIAGYRVWVVKRQTPSDGLLAWSQALNKQPLLQTIYTIMVAKKEETGYGEPQQRSLNHFEISTIVDELDRWNIPVIGWQPDEEEGS